jgi:serine phosphatase RsbU (regulator of sigma subunit)
MELEGDRLGIIVGDVSGKGVSAAFYMSEVKGIFQALGRMYTSPREFMISANAALAGSIDKHSFVSLIYGIVDLATGSLVISRAGHCPMLYVSGNSVAYIRPTGMGLGLTTGELFGNAMEEHTLTLREGDVCLFYTDGVTEARHDGDEFGYDRLLALVQRIRHKSASEIKNEVLQTVQNFTGNQPTHDDLTLVVLKWLGSRPEDRERTSIGDTKNE